MSTPMDMLVIVVVVRCKLVCIPMPDTSGGIGMECLCGSLAGGGTGYWGGRWGT